MSGEARFGFSHISDGGLTFEIRRIPQLGDSPPRGVWFPNPLAAASFSKSDGDPVYPLGTCWQEDSGGVEQERGSTVEPVTHEGLERER